MIWYKGLVYEVSKHAHELRKVARNIHDQDDLREEREAYEAAVNQLAQTDAEMGSESYTRLALDLDEKEDAYFAVFDGRDDI